MKREEILDIIQNALLYEHSLKKLQDQNESLLNSRPSAPIQPTPPTIKTPTFQPVPYPDIIVPDFGLSPWYKRASACIIAAIVIFVITMAAVPYIPIMPYGSTSPIELIGALSGLFIWLAIIFTLKAFIGKDNRSENYVTQIQSSPYYKQQCAQIDAQNATKYQNAVKQAQADYEQSCIAYENRIIPDYKINLKKYKEILLPQWNQAQNELQERVLQTKQKLDAVYNSNIIPYEYRNIDALEFIVPYMESSQSSLQEAITQYEKKKSDELIRNMIASQEDQASEMQQIMEDQQRTIEELQNQLDETQRAARSAKHWSMAGTALSGYAAYKSRKNSVRR